MISLGLLPPLADGNKNSAHLTFVRTPPEPDSAAKLFIAVGCYDCHKRNAAAQGAFMSPEPTFSREPEGPVRASPFLCVSHFAFVGLSFPIMAHA